MTGSDLKASPVTERLRPQRHRGHRRPRRRQRRGGRPGHRVARPSPTTTPRSSRPDGGDRRAAPGRGAGRHRRPAPLRGRGRHPRQDDHAVDAGAACCVEAGLRPSFLIGGDINEFGTNAAWDDGEWLVVEADESDGTFLALSPTSPWSPTSRPTTSTTTAAFDARPRPPSRVLGSRRDAPGGLRRRPGGRRARAAAAPTWSGRAPDADYRIVDVALGRSCVAFGLSARRGGLGRSGAARARVSTTPATPRWPRSPRWPSGRPSTPAGRALARYAGVARRFEFRGDGRRGHLRRRLRPPARARCGPRWPRPATAAGPGGRRLPAPPLHPDRGRCGDRVRGRLRDADVVVVTDVYAAGEAPVPGVSGRLVADAVAGAHPDSRSTTSPGRAELRRQVAGLLAARGPVLHPGRRRPDLAPRRAACADPRW